MGIFEFFSLPITKTRQLPSRRRPLVAHVYNSGFPFTRNPYNSIAAASDGYIYYILSSWSLDVGGQLFLYDPRKDEIEFLYDLTRICGEEFVNAIPQGKSHVPFFEKGGKLFFATHVGVYEVVDGMERLPGELPEGYKPYPGGHILSYDLHTSETQDLAVAPEGEGILTLEMDRGRGDLYGITWPKGYFIHYEPEKGTLKNLGRVSANGEAGTPGDDYSVLCRSMFIDPESRAVYYSTSGGEIFSYRPGAKTIEKVPGAQLRLDYFGRYDPARQGSMAYNWRKILWYAPEEVAYGVHATGYLFRFDPRTPQVELVDRIASEPSKKCGMYDMFYYGYLGFDLGPDGETLYYLTGGPVYIDGKRAERDDAILIGSRGIENIHLVTYQIPDREYRDHGPVFFPDGSRPQCVNSIAIGVDGHVYTLARYRRDDDTVASDLIKITDPFR